ncbi:hypothetical protein IF1G_00875 [Cordyceps javanica]|uniref:Uncharacterized protein n=1 Tax=Cordyceps javanica TaxID=43265 RepID=A0A545VGT5_9HYPO|nr:hypothetical protein IF1G_00875 [Cordyceps javanica]
MCHVWCCAASGLSSARRRPRDPGEALSPQGAQDCAVHRQAGKREAESDADSGRLEMGRCDAAFLFALEKALSFPLKHEQASNQGLVTLVPGFAFLVDKEIRTGQ